MRLKPLIAILVLSFFFLSSPMNLIADDGEVYRVEEILKVRLPIDISQGKYLEYLQKKLPEEEAQEIEKKVNTNITAALDANPMVTPQYLVVNQDWSEIKFSSTGVAAQQAPDRTGNGVTLAPVINPLDIDSCGSTNISDRSIPWTNEEANEITSMGSQVYDSLINIVGYPYENQTIKVYHCPNFRYSAETVNTSYNLPGQPIIPVYFRMQWDRQSQIERQSTLWHEMVHAWYGYYTVNRNAYSGVLWSEPIAVVGAYLTEQYYNLPHSTYLQLENRNYEQHNRPELQRYGITTTQAVSGSDTASFYTMGGGAWYKLYLEHPDIIKRFSDKLYTDYYSVIISSTRKMLPFLSDGLKILDDLIKSSDSVVSPKNSIEGESIYQWFPKQYGFMETISPQKLGAKLLPNGEFYAGYYRTNYRAKLPEQPLFAELTGDINYEVYNFNNQIIETSEPTAINGDFNVDLADTIRRGQSDFPQGKYCAKAIMGGVIETSSCYYFTGGVPENQRGIFGTIGEQNYLADGTITITPSQGQNTSIKTYYVQNGGFIASGNNNDFYTLGGRYFVEYNSSNGLEKASKYITKEPNNYYHLTMTVEEVPFVLTGLSAVSNSNYYYVRPVANKPVAISYYISWDSESENPKLDLQQKSWGTLNELKLGKSVTPITESDGYKISIYDNYGQGIYGNQTYKFNFTENPFSEDVFFSKWADRKSVSRGQNMKYSIGVSNLKSTNLEGSISDSLDSVISGGFQPPQNISDGGSYDSDTQIVSWPSQTVPVNQQKIYSFDVQL